MLAAITDQLRDQLKEQGCPLAVVYGPLSLEQTVRSESRVVVEIDTAVDETFSAPICHQYNPRPILQIAVPGLVSIYARSRVAGALRQNHERLARAVLTQVLRAMNEIIRLRGNTWNISGGGFLAPSDLDDDEGRSFPGVVYVLRFTFDRTVYDVDYDGEEPGEYDFQSTAINTTVSLDGSGHAGLPSASTRIST